MAINKQLRVLIGDTGDTLAVSIAHELLKHNIWAIIRSAGSARTS